MKKIIITIVVIGLLVGVFFAFNKYIYNQKQQVTGSDHKNAEYIIDGKRVKLENGYSEESIPGSSSKIITKYFGNELKKDLNDDGLEDVVFLLTQETGGSGVFFYVAGAINSENGFIGSEALLLGDRIAPQNTNSGTGKIIVVNYADRKPGESFAVSPSLGKSIWLILDPTSMQFGEVVQNFEGEADPSRMTLGMKTWEWTKTSFVNGTEFKPKQAGKFTIKFEGERFSVTTDCNSGSGTFTSNSTNITFENMASTLMFCTESQETEFFSFLENARTYEFTSKGELLIKTKAGEGTMYLR